MKGASLTLVQSVDDAQRLLSWLGERREVLGMDTETEGLRLYGGDRLRMFQVGDTETGWAVDVRDWRGLVGEVLQRYDRPIAFHNAKFDLHALEIEGLPTPGAHLVHDTMLMDHILDPARAHGLKPVGERYWPGSSAGGYQLSEDMRKGKWDWKTVPTDLLSYWSYSAWDTVLTARIFEKHWPDLNSRGLVEPYEIELAVQDVCRRMERKGLPIDSAYAHNLLDEWVRELEDIKIKLDALQVANPNSNRQVVQALQIVNKWNPVELTPTGEAKLDEPVLSGIDSEIATLVLRHRRLTKWKKAYLEAFIQDRDSSGRVHASIRTLGARTGRMSITDPPLQTLPRGPIIRHCVQAPEGFRIWACDYDTMEMRVFAHYAQEPDLLAAIADGVDLHTYAAQQVYRDSSIQKSDPRRQLAKNVGFALIYGAGAAKIAITAGVPEGEARSFVGDYKARFSGVDRFMQSVDNTVTSRLAGNGRAWVTSWGGRPLTLDPKRLYSGVNYLIQGSCADLMKRKLVALDCAGFGDNLLLPVHDEFIFEFPEGETEGPREASKIMEDFHSFSAPLTTELSGPYNTWGEKYE